jgi:hypothetical protein
MSYYNTFQKESTTMSQDTIMSFVQFVLDSNGTPDFKIQNLEAIAKVFFTHSFIHHLFNTPPPPLLVVLFTSYQDTTTPTG